MMIGLKQRIENLLKYRAPEYDYTRQLVLIELSKTIEKIPKKFDNKILMKAIKSYIKSPENRLRLLMLIKNIRDDVLKLLDDKEKNAI